MRGRQLTLAAFWVGLDGYESNTVEQTGTEADCEGRREVYYAWYELYPQRLFVIAHEVKPGDALSAAVTNSTLTLEDRRSAEPVANGLSPQRTDDSNKGSRTDPHSPPCIRWVGRGLKRGISGAAVVIAPMAKHLVDIDEQALRDARERLGARTIKETVNRAVRLG